MKTFKLIVLAVVLAASPACKKKSDPPKTTEGSGQTMGSAKPEGSAAPEGSAKPEGSAAPEGSAKPEGSGASVTPPLAFAQSIEVQAEHKKKKATDPITVKFEKFKVTKATFDPANIEGGKATIEVDLSSLASTPASGQRDTHLKSPDYLDVGKLATMTIEVDNVKKKEGMTFTADATVKLHGVEKKYPVTFDVVEAKDDWINVRGEHKFSRTDFKVGKDPKDKDESVAADVTIKVALTLKKT